MKLSHPDSKQSIEVADDSVETYLTQGWEEVGKKPTSAEDK